MDSPVSNSLLDFQEQYFQFACAHEPGRAGAVIDQALKAGTSIQDVYIHIILATQKRIGDLWSEGRFGVADEHLVTQISISELARIRHFIRPKGDRNRTVTVVAVAQDQHTLGARVVADFFIMDGWRVHFLGGNVPREELVRFVSENRTDLVALSVVLDRHLPEAEETVAALQQLSPTPKVLVGGAAFLTARGRTACPKADVRAIKLEDSIREAQKLFNMPVSPIEFELFLQQIGRRVRQFRKARGMNQKAVADQSGLDRAYLSGIENGKQNLSMHALFKIAEALNVDIEDLIVDRTDYQHFQ